MSELPATVESRADVWGTPPTPDSLAVVDRSSRQFPVSSFDPLSAGRASAQDYYEYHRTLDSIEARLQKLKQDACLAIKRAELEREIIADQQSTARTEKL